MKPHSKEYNTVMKDLFGERGFPLEKDYSVQSAKVGVSLFEEKDETDINEMKSKVLQRASAVLIMRPRSAAASQTQYLRRQKAMLASGRAPKQGRSKVQKKLTGAQTEGKAVADNAKSDQDVKLDLYNSNEASKKSSLSSNTKGKKMLTEPKKRSDLPLPIKHSEQSTSVSKKKAAEEEKATDSVHNEPATDVKDTEDNISDILAAFSQGGDIESKSHQDVLVTDSHYPLSNRVWDKSAVPKPWDKWASLRKSDVNSKSADSSKPPKVDPRAPHSSQKTLLKPTTRPSTGRSWHPSSPSQKATTSQEKRPQSATVSAPRHSWTGEYYPEAELLHKFSGCLDSHGLNLPVSKRKAVVDWLDKHVNSSREGEHTSASSSSSSIIDTDLGCGFLSANNLADVTAQAAGVESYDSSTRLSAWLASLGLKNVESYEQMFAQHQIDMVDLPSMTVPVLQQIGISKLGPVMKIMRGVDKLKAELSKTTKKMKQLEDFDKADHAEKLRGLCKQSSGAGENQNSVHSDAADRAFSSRSQADRPVESKNLKESRGVRSSSEKTFEEKKASPAERAENLRSSLQELYRQMSREKAHAQNCREGVLSGISGETSPFECAHFQAEGGYSETSTNVPQVNSESDASQRRRASQGSRASWNTGSLPVEEAREVGRSSLKTTADQSQGKGCSFDGESHKCSAAEGEMKYCSFGLVSKPKQDSNQDPGMCEERVLHRAPLPQTDKIPPKAAAGQAKKSAKASQSRSNGLVAKAAGKAKDQPTSSKVKGQGDASLLRPASGKIDTGLCVSCLHWIQYNSMQYNTTRYMYYKRTECPYCTLQMEILLVHLTWITHKFIKYKTTRSAPEHTFQCDEM